MPPKHERPKPADWLNSDLWALIHWQPKLTTDSSGKASPAFYNADITGTVQVVVEAIAANSQIGTSR
ncbi:MAG: hypothetical protein ABIN01_07050 [Ferruginibacter sp.]